MRRFGLILFALAVLGAAGCAGSSSASIADSTTAPTTGSGGTAAVTPKATTQVTAAPSIGGYPLGVVGTPTKVTYKGVAYANVTVSDVKISATYSSASGRSVDKPQNDGDVFISVRVTFEALREGVEYGYRNFETYVGGTKLDAVAFVLNGPIPLLGAGTLPNGRSATGYIIYEVPAKGEVRLSYMGPDPVMKELPVFEVVIRPE